MGSKIYLHYEKLTRSISLFLSRFVYIKKNNDKSIDFDYIQLLEALFLYKITKYLQCSRKYRIKGQYYLP